MRISFTVNSGGIIAMMTFRQLVTLYRPRHCKATFARFIRRGMVSYHMMKRGRRTDPASRMLAPLAGKRDARLRCGLLSLTIVVGSVRRGQKPPSGREAWRRILSLHHSIQFVPTIPFVPILVAEKHHSVPVDPASAFAPWAQKFDSIPSKWTVLRSG